MFDKISKFWKTNIENKVSYPKFLIDITIRYYSQLVNRPTMTVDKNKMKRFTSMKTLLTKCVVNDWVAYLNKKKLRTRRMAESKLKEVVLHKKVLRD
jgi:hypothetical protein